MPTTGSIAVRQSPEDDDGGGPKIGTFRKRHLSEVSPRHVSIRDPGCGRSLTSPAVAFAVDATSRAYDLDPERKETDPPNAAATDARRA